MDRGTIDSSDKTIILTTVNFAVVLVALVHYYKRGFWTIVKITNSLDNFSPRDQRHL